jgi:tetratricopeptide (TPR) repeat protein
MSPPSEPDPRPPHDRASRFPRRWLLLAAFALGACTDADIRRGDDALGLGRYDEAIGAYESARRRLPAEQTPVDRLASAHRALAATLMERGRCADARAHFALAAGLTRPLLIDHQQLYECDVARNVPKEELVADLLRLLELGDRRASVLRKLMHVEIELGRDADAADRLTLLEKRSAITLDERRLLAQVFLRLDRRREAFDHLKATIALSPNDPINRLKLAELAEEQGEAPLAREIYEALTVEYPQNPLTWLRLAAFRTRTGDAAGARNAQGRADALRTGHIPPPQEMRPLRKSRR